MRLCINHSPPDYPERLQRGLLGYLFSRLSLYLRRRRNPRSMEYMEALCTEQFGTDYTIVAASDISVIAIGEVDEIVLLWPDGNGYGWAAIERTVFSKMDAKAKLTVLNGRRRSFNFNKKLRVQYLLRRFAERFWIAEIFSTALFILVTPLLLLWDFAKGRS